MLSQSYFKTIKSVARNLRWTFHRTPSTEHQLKILELMESQPDKLFVENVRAFFDVPKENAEYLCEQAVKAGLLTKKTGLSCPNDQRIIAVLDEEVPLPESVSCEVCEDLEREQTTFNTSDLNRVLFYQSTQR
jgi:hypothetical protein